MQETKKHRFYPWKDPLEKGMATCSSVLAWRIPWIEEPADYSPWGRKELDTPEATWHTHTETVIMSLLIITNQFHIW